MENNEAWFDVDYIRKKPESINDLLEVGLYIANAIKVCFINIGIAHGKEINDPIVVFIYQGYQIWKMNTEEWIKKLNLPLIETQLFFQTDSVPPFKSGIVYSTLNDPKTIDLLEKMKTETNRNLTNLAEFGKNIPTKNSKKTLKNIELYKNLDGHMEVYVNNDHDNPIFPRTSVRKKPYWEVLYIIATTKKYTFDKDVRNYFNSHSNNPIYRRGFEKTQILSQRGKFLVVSKGVKIKLKRKKIN